MLSKLKVIKGRALIFILLWRPSLRKLLYDPPSTKLSWTPSYIHILDQKWMAMVGLNYEWASFVNVKLGDDS